MSGRYDDYEAPPPRYDERRDGGYEDAPPPRRRFEDEERYDDRRRDRYDERPPPQQRYDDRRYDERRDERYDDRRAPPRQDDRRFDDRGPPPRRYDDERGDRRRDDDRYDRGGGYDDRRRYDSRPPAGDRPWRPDKDNRDKGPGTNAPPPPPETDGEPPNAFIFERLVEREKARVRRDFGTADSIRDELSRLGVEIWESKGERTWRAKDGRMGPRPNHEGKCF